MGKINVLSFSVANLIAAGEVVDRPASVIKELLENAIDSGADRITVEIQNGGVTFMRVSDNGCGIDADDLPVAIRRHATSKIKEAHDLDGILTLGFRGEALAAIAAVSHMRIISKTREAQTGSMLEALGGDILGIHERAASDGTTVIVEELFANVPARRKFLKKDVTEASAICAAVEKIALSRPDIAFNLIVDGNQKLQTVGDGKLLNAVYSIFGRDFASRLLPLKYTVDGISISGFVGRSDNTRANRNYQNFFINGRFVKSKTAMAALEQAYTSYIPPDKFPCCILNIEINPSTVDVNVHPAKLEVKFSNEKPVFEAIYYAVRAALEENVTRPDLTFGREKAKNAFAPKLSDMQTPVTDKRGESLGSRQISAELYTTPKAQPGQDKFVHISAAQYADQYVSAKLPKEYKKLVEEQLQKEKKASEAITPKDTPKEPERHDVEIKKEQVTPSPAPQSAPAEEKKTVYNAETPAAAPAEQSVPIKPHRIVGELFNSYVVVELGDKMLLVDKHAAHERVIFEGLKKNLREHATVSQMLMIPLEVMMTSAEVSAIDEYKSEIEAVGFELECGKYTVSVSAVPEGISLEAVNDMLAVIADRIITSSQDAMITRNIVFEKALYQASCKAAIKAGREYPPEYVEWLIDKLVEIPDITFCPHGRPVAMELSKKKIDHQFERT